MTAVAPSWTYRRIIGTACRVSVALMLLVAARTHLGNGYQFLQSILAYELVPGELAVGLATLIPALELVLGTALLFAPALRRTACWACVALFLVFLIAQSSALARGLDISCGCFSSTGARLGWQSIATALLGLLLSLGGLVGIRRKV